MLRNNLPAWAKYNIFRNTIVAPMQRRTFLSSSLALPFISAAPALARRQIIPARLEPGDTVGLITPGSFLSDDGVAKAETQLRSLGFKVRRSQFLRAENGFTAGTDKERLADLHTMFADPTIKAIWCGRGGYDSYLILIIS